MKVGDIMATGVVSVAPDTPFKQVVERLLQAGVSSVPVVDTEGKLLGLVTEADLISKEAYDGHRNRALALLADALAGRDHHWVAKAAGAVAADVMTKHVMVCTPDEDVRAAARRMLERGVKRMPVVHDGAVVGMMSRHDILRTYDRADAAITADLQRAFSDPLRMPEDAHVRCSVDDGVVTLTGDVRYEWDEAIVAAVARAVSGVVDVTSHLRHREENPRPSSQPPMFGAR